MSSLRASGLVLVTAVSLLWVPASFAQDSGETTTGTTTETTSTSEPTSTETTQTDSTETAPAPNPWAETPESRLLLRQATRYKRTARRLHRLMGKPRPRVARHPAQFDSLLAYRQWLRRAWRSKAVRAQNLARRPPHLGAWRCIHRHEGPWRDPNSPYYGGLQMDLTFQRQYGPDLLRKKGTADRWTPYEQMWVAERALRSGRGFYPWPLTARRCGLI